MQGAVVRTPARFALAAVALATVTLSQQLAIADENLLHTTVVTATRTETKLDETLADVTVINQSQIEKLAPNHSLAEVLQRLAGLQISSNGGRGNSQNIYTRGTGSTHTLLLIDGVRYGSATMAEPVLSNIPIELIDRIEIIQGPSSSIYGSEAVGGVIQIFTNSSKHINTPFRGKASTTIGEYGYRSGEVGFQGVANGFNYNLNVSRALDHGISASNSKAPSYIYNSDSDGFDQTAVAANFGYKINSKLRFDVSFMNSDGRAYTDNGANNNSYVDQKAQVTTLKVTGNLYENWISKISYGESIDKQNNLGSNYPSHFNTKQNEYKFENEINTNLGTFILGVERLEQRVDTSNDYALNNRSINAFFLGVNGNINSHYWQGNFRRDDNSQFGNLNTYSLTYGYEIFKKTRFYASHGKSMRAPSFNDLYYYDPFWSDYNGNTNLQPEESKTNEIGLNWSSISNTAKINYFSTKSENLIASSGTNGMANLPGETSLKGWNAEYKAYYNKYTISTLLNHLKTKQSDGTPLNRRAKNQISLNISKEIGLLQIGGNALFVGKRKDSDKILKSYATLDLFAEYKLRKDWSLLARISNLTNREYETAYGYNQRGRAGYLTLKWAPK